MYNTTLILNYVLYDYIQFSVGSSIAHIRKGCSPSISEKADLHNI